MGNIHPKVFSATIGAGVGGTLSAFVLWILGITAWHAPADAGGAEQAIAAVPAPVVGIVALALTVGATFASGWLAKSAPDVNAVITDWSPADLATLTNGDSSGSEPSSPVDSLEPVGGPVADPTEAEHA